MRGGSKGRFGDSFPFHLRDPESGAQNCPRISGAILPFLLLAFLTLIPTPAQADELRPGYLELTERAPNQWRMMWKAPVKEGLASRATPVFPADCTSSNQARELIDGALVAESDLTCAKPLAGRSVGLDGLSATVSDALVRVAPLGRPVQAARLTADAPTTTIATTPDRWQVAKTYFALGAEHILLGFDLLLFVVSLVLLISGGWTVVRTVTAFTVAHSITLVGVTLGLVSLPQKPVEAVIALSIAFLAVEIVKQKPGSPRLSERIPWAVAFLFGLLHGFGFAGALKEIGMPETEVPTALLTFNLGVEAGQLMIVAAALASLTLLRKFAAAWDRPARVTAAYGIGTLSCFWLIERLV